MLEAIKTYLTQYWGPYLVILLAAGAAIAAMMLVIREWTAYVSARRKAVYMIYKGVLVLGGGMGLFMLWHWSRLGGLVAVGESLYSAIRLFFVDGTLDFFEKTHLGPPELHIAFAVSYYLVCLAAVLCTATALLSFFRDLTNHIRLWGLSHSRHSYIYVFNELNDRSLAIANDLYENTDYTFYDDKKPRLHLIFCDVHARNDEASFEKISRAEKMGGICFKEDISEIHRELRNRIRRSNRGTDLIESKSNPRNHYFLISEDESENVSQAIAITDDLKGKAKGPKNAQNLLISVFVSGDADGRILDELNVGPDQRTLQPYVVRRMDPAIMLAWNVVTRHPLVGPGAYDEALPQRYRDDERDLRVLLVGAGQYGLALLKTLLWYYQRSRGSITVYLADRNGETEDLLRGTCPDLLKNCNLNDPNDGAYDVQFLPTSDVFGGAFAQQFNQLKDLDAVFIALGDDDSNVEASLHLRTLYDRRHYDDIAAGRTWRPCKFLAVVHSDIRRNNLKNFHTKGLRIQDYDITYVGNYGKVYSYKSIHHPEEEYDARAYNDARKKDKPYFNVWDYLATEYNRLSSLSFRLHLDLMYRLYDDQTMRREGDRICNNRWNVYMRTIGYINPDPDLELSDELFRQNPPRRQWHRGKWHTSITPFDRMGPAEQANNYTTPEIYAMEQERRNKK